jgi:hypothetical protein
VEELCGGAGLDGGGRALQETAGSSGRRRRRDVGDGGHLRAGVEQGSPPWSVGEAACAADGGGGGGGGADTSVRLCV